MIRIRRSSERGHVDHGWLDARHTFSFAGYYDPAHMGFRSLRVMNEDRVAPGQGFGTHGHRDMEIVTLVLEGQLEHKDSMGHGEILRPGEFQHMGAGTGVRHSEFNPSATEPVHLYQIWLTPEREGLAPSYEQKAFAAAGRQFGWQRVASPTGEDGSLTIRQDATLLLAALEDGSAREYAFTPGRHGWLQVLRGNVSANGHALAAGDGMALSDEPRLTLLGTSAAEVLLFDLA